MIRCLKTLAVIAAALMTAAGGPHDAEAQEWGALAFGEYRTSVAWAFDSGNSEFEAETAARNRCSRLLGFSCRSWGAFANSCAAIAVSECPPSSCSQPAYGFSTGSSRNEAGAGAIAQCEDAARGSEVAGTCRVATSDHGEPGVVCVGR